jgi:hypothetical protein
MEGALTSLRRRWRTIKRVVIGLIVVVALSGLAVLSNWIVRELNDKAERAAQRAAWDTQRRAARQRWEQMSPHDRGWAKLMVRIGGTPHDPQERVKFEQLRDFVPEIYEPETEEEKAASFDPSTAVLDEPTPTPTPIRYQGPSEREDDTSRRAVTRRTATSLSYIATFLRIIATFVMQKRCRTPE